MVDEVKLNNMINPATLGPAPKRCDQQQEAQKDNYPKEGDVTVSSKLSSMTAWIASQQEEPVNKQRVSEIRHQIEHHQYHVDVDQLADKLANSLVTR